MKPKPAPDRAATLTRGSDVQGAHVCAVEATAWAIGASGAFKSTLTLKWTGSAWSRVPSLSTFAGSNFVNAVAATSTKDAWIVGGGTKGKGSSATYTLILHWNGAAWS